MNWYVVRLGRACITILLLIAFAFFALAASGDPAVILLGPDTSQAAIDVFREKWGLNLPLWQQFLIYLNGLLHLDFGLSYRSGESALRLVLDRIPLTLSLVFPTILLSIAVGVPLGIVSAMHRGRFIDRFAIILSVIGLAIPPFLLGVLAMYLFSVKLGWLAPIGYVDWTSYIMPVVTLSTVGIATYARFTRSAMVEVMARPMIETARASGFTEGIIHRVHALPNALLPLITITALEFGNFVSYAAVIENVFGWQGAGSLLVASVSARDFAVVQAILIITGATMIVGNLLADLSYGLIDPRIRDMRRLSSRRSSIWKSRKRELI
ncbi:ABC transporter permease [Microvirga sp. VF16]|uniref:ABC transporter permease n=1 Tax=Microvirga sp. VF16 TaxID=2807101 RepID=UPI00193DC2F5|nr:ABC transporter permease [Microvirga sp. VF16]QRM33266.1 ABC transporter permease [Microvirga sp. VF16]